MEKVNEGIKNSANDLSDRNVTVSLKASSKVDEAEQLRFINELVEEGITGLAIMPIESELIRARLNELSNKMPIITFNSDIVGINKTHYVGMDNLRSGKTAAGLIGSLIKNCGKVLLITGHLSNSVNVQRIDGFVEEIKKSYNGIEIIGIQCSHDDAKEVKRIIVDSLSNISDIDAILIVSGGQMGVIDAFKELNLDTKPHVVSYDVTSKNITALKNNYIDFLIDQDGYTQGFKPIKLIYDKLMNKDTEKKKQLYTEIVIKNKYNI